MTLPKFEYFAPQSLDEVRQLLLDHGEGAHLLAGGTDLLVKMNHGLLKPTAVIALKQIEGMNKIIFDPKDGLRIGATALLAEVAEHPDILDHYPAIAAAALETANVQIRNMGTVAGNLCNAAPSADTAPAVVAGRVLQRTRSKCPRARRNIDRYSGSRSPDEIGCFLPAHFIPWKCGHFRRVRRGHGVDGGRYLPGCQHIFGRRSAGPHACRKSREPRAWKPYER